jgi:hypothetical protein
MNPVRVIKYRRGFSIKEVLSILSVNRAILKQRWERVTGNRNLVNKIKI